MRSHRGLSAVVGTVFLVAVVLGALSYVSYSLDVMGNFSESLIAEESRQKDKQTEAFEVSTIDVTTANKLDGIVKNTGEIPVELKTLYIDEQGVNDVVQKFTLNEAIAPGNTVNLIDLVDFDIDPTKGYNMKVVSGRGEVNAFFVNSPSTENLQMYISAIPEYVPTSFTTTVLYSVVNNMSNGNVLYNVTPDLTMTDEIGTSVGNIRNGPTPNSYPTLNPGDIATFEYSVQLSGEVDDMVSFNATVLNGIPSNWAYTEASIQEVEEATQAGTSIESVGLASEENNSIGILYFHDQTVLTPNGEYQMDAGDPSGSGSTGDVVTTTYEFITANMTAETDVIPGYWNASFAYYTHLVPKSVSDISGPSFAFSMQCEDCASTANNQIYDLTGNITSHDFVESGDPDLISSGGPHDQAYYEYDGDEYHYAEWDTNSQYLDEAWLDGETTTMIWVRVDSAENNDSYVPIIRWGDEDDGGDDEYEIAIGERDDSGDEGKVMFRYTAKDENDETECEGPLITYDKWIFIAGTADIPDEECHLYVAEIDDGEPSASYVDVNNANDKDDTVDIDDTQDIRIAADGRGDRSIVDVAMFMHWNDRMLSLSEIQDIYNVDYGPTGDAVSVDLLLEKTDDDGDTLPPGQGGTMFSQTITFPYADLSEDAEAENKRIDLSLPNDDYDKYSFANYTYYTSANQTFNEGERFKLSLSWASDDSSLPFYFRIDDSDSQFTQWKDSSYIQTPPVYPDDWPTFTSFDRTEDVIYRAQNSGPDGAYFTYAGTRLLVTTVDGTESWAGVVKEVNGVTVSTTQDSEYIPDQGMAEITFSPVSDPPQTNPSDGEIVPVGQYNAAVFLSGYDDEGEVFSRTINIGTVNIYDNP